MRAGKSRLKLRITALLLILCFTCDTAVWSAPVVPAAASAAVSSRPVLLPRELGEIRETFEGDPAKDGLRPRLPRIFYIQDAHSSIDAQRHTMRILEWLDKQDLLDEVFLEGSEGRLESRYLNFFKEREHSTEAARTLMADGILSGAEYFLLKHPRKPVTGIESIRDYDDNLKAFAKILQKEDSVREFARRLREEIEKEFSRSAGRELMTFYKKWLAPFNSSEDWLKHLEELNVFAQETLQTDFGDPRAQAEWPELSRLFKTFRLAAEINPEQARAEFEAAADWAEKKNLPAALAEGLRARTVAADDLTQDLNHREFFEAFIAAAAPLGFDLNRYPQFKNRLAWLILEQEINVEAARREIEVLTRALSARLVKNAQDQKLVELHEDAALAVKLLQGELTREEYIRVQERAEEYRPSVLIQRVSGRTAKSSLDETWRAALDFYAGALKREEIIFSRLLERMNEPRIRSAALITGGFHGAGLKEMMRSRGIEFVEIIPRIGELESGAHYRDLVRGRGNYTVLKSHVPQPRLGRGLLFLKEHQGLTAAQLYAQAVNRAAGSVIFNHGLNSNAFGEGFAANGLAYAPDGMLFFDNKPVSLAEGADFAAGLSSTGVPAAFPLMEKRKAETGFEEPVLEIRSEQRAREKEKPGKSRKQVKRARTLVRWWGNFVSLLGAVPALNTPVWAWVLMSGFVGSGLALENRMLDAYINERPEIYHVSENGKLIPETALTSRIRFEDFTGDARLLTGKGLRGTADHPELMHAIQQALPESRLRTSEIRIIRAEGLQIDSDGGLFVPVRIEWDEFSQHAAVTPNPVPVNLDADSLVPDTEDLLILQQVISGKDTLENRNLTRESIRWAYRLLLAAVPGIFWALLAGMRRHEGPATTSSSNASKFPSQSLYQGDNRRNYLGGDDRSELRNDDVPFEEWFNEEQLDMLQKALDLSGDSRLKSFMEKDYERAKFSTRAELASVMRTRVEEAVVKRAKKARSNDEVEKLNKTLARFREFYYEITEEYLLMASTDEEYRQLMQFEFDAINRGSQRPEWTAGRRIYLFKALEALELWEPALLVSHRMVNLYGHARQMVEVKLKWAQMQRLRHAPVPEFHIRGSVIPELTESLKQIEAEIESAGKKNTLVMPPREIRSVDQLRSPAPDPEDKKREDARRIRREGTHAALLSELAAYHMLLGGKENVEQAMRYIDQARTLYPEEHYVNFIHMKTRLMRTTFLEGAAKKEELDAIRGMRDEYLEAFFRNQEGRLVEGEKESWQRFFSADADLFDGKFAAAAEVLKDIYENQEEAPSLRLNTSLDLLVALQHEGRMDEAAAVLPVYLRLVYDSLAKGSTYVNSTTTMEPFKRKALEETARYALQDIARWPKDRHAFTQLVELVQQYHLISFDSFQAQALKVFAALEQEKMDPMDYRDQIEAFFFGLLERRNHASRTRALMRRIAHENREKNPALRELLLSIISQQAEEVTQNFEDGFAALYASVYGRDMKLADMEQLTDAYADYVDAYLSLNNYDLAAVVKLYDRTASILRGWISPQMSVDPKLLAVGIEQVAFYQYSLFRDDTRDNRLAYNEKLRRELPDMLKTVQRMSQEFKESGGIYSDLMKAVFMLGSVANNVSDYQSHDKAIQLYYGMFIRHMTNSSDKQRADKGVPAAFSGDPSLRYALAGKSLAALMKRAGAQILDRDFRNLDETFYWLDKQLLSIAGFFLNAEQNLTTVDDREEAVRKLRDIAHSLSAGQTTIVYVNKSLLDQAGDVIGQILDDDVVKGANLLLHTAADRINFMQDIVNAGELVDWTFWKLAMKPGTRRHRLLVKLFQQILEDPLMQSYQHTRAGILEYLAPMLEPGERYRLILEHVLPIELSEMESERQSVKMMDLLAEAQGLAVKFGDEENISKLRTAYEAWLAYHLKIMTGEESDKKIENTYQEVYYKMHLGQYAEAAAILEPVVEQVKTNTQSYRYYVELTYALLLLKTGRREEAAALVRETMMRPKPLAKQPGKGKKNKLETDPQPVEERFDVNLAHYMGQLGFKMEQGVISELTDLVAAVYTEEGALDSEKQRDTLIHAAYLDQKRFADRLIEDLRRADNGEREVNMQRDRLSVEWLAREDDTAMRTFPIFDSLTRAGKFGKVNAGLRKLLDDLRRKASPDDFHKRAEAAFAAGEYDEVVFLTEQGLKMLEGSKDTSLSSKLKAIDKLARSAKQEVEKIQERYKAMDYRAVVDAADQFFQTLNSSDPAVKKLHRTAGVMHSARSLAEQGEIAEAAARIETDLPAGVGDKHAGFVLQLLKNFLARVEEAGERLEQKRYLAAENLLESAVMELKERWNLSLPDDQADVSRLQQEIDDEKSTAAQYRSGFAANGSFANMKENAINLASYPEHVNETYELIIDKAVKIFNKAGEIRIHGSEQQKEEQRQRKRKLYETAYHIARLAYEVSAYYDNSGPSVLLKQAQVILSHAAANVWLPQLMDDFAIVSAMVLTDEKIEERNRSDYMGSVEQVTFDFSEFEITRGGFKLTGLTYTDKDGAVQNANMPDHLYSGDSFRIRRKQTPEEVKTKTVPEPLKEFFSVKSRGEDWVEFDVPKAKSNRDFYLETLRDELKKGGTIIRTQNTVAVRQRNTLEQILRFLVRTTAETLTPEDLGAALATSGNDLMDHVMGIRMDIPDAARSASIAEEDTRIRAWIADKVQARKAQNPDFDLDPAQEDAVAAMLNKHIPFVLVQGPPGTGKTMTSVFAIDMLYNLNTGMMVSSQQHHAVDNVVRGLLNLNESRTSKIKVARVGATADESIKDADILKLWNDRAALLEEMQSAAQAGRGFVVAKTTNGMDRELNSRDYLLERTSLLKMDESTRATRAEALYLMDWLERLTHVDFVGDPFQLPAHGVSDEDRMKALEELKRSGIQRLELLDGRMEPVMVNDIFSKPKLDNFRISLFEKSLEFLLPDNVQEDVFEATRPAFFYLDVQRRSGTDIVDLINYFYQKRRALKAGRGETGTVIEDDTRGRSREFKEKSGSTFNDGEIQRAVHWVNYLMNEKELPEEDVAIISPYKAQVGRLLEAFSDISALHDYLAGREAGETVDSAQAVVLKSIAQDSVFVRDRIEEVQAEKGFKTLPYEVFLDEFEKLLLMSDDSPEARQLAALLRQSLGLGPRFFSPQVIASGESNIVTVDSAIGNEWKAVIIPWTRSNPKGEVGFLSTGIDGWKRRNVAISRAQDYLIWIWDRSTFTRARDREIREWASYSINVFDKINARHELRLDRPAPHYLPEDENFLILSGAEFLNQVTLAASGRRSAVKGVQDRFDAEDVFKFLDSRAFPEGFVEVSSLWLRQGIEHFLNIYKIKEQENLDRALTPSRVFRIIFQARGLGAPMSLEIEKTVEEVAALVKLIQSIPNEDENHMNYTLAADILNDWLDRGHLSAAYMFLDRIAMAAEEDTDTLNLAHRFLEIVFNFQMMGSRIDASVIDTRLSIFHLYADPLSRTLPLRDHKRLYEFLPLRSELRMAKKDKDQRRKERKKKEEKKRQAAGVPQTGALRPGVVRYQTALPMPESFASHPAAAVFKTIGVDVPQKRHPFGREGWTFAPFPKAPANPVLWREAFYPWSRTFNGILFYQDRPVALVGFPLSLDDFPPATRQSNIAALAAQGVHARFIKNNKYYLGFELVQAAATLHLSQQAQQVLEYAFPKHTGTITNEENFAWFNFDPVLGTLEVAKGLSAATRVVFPTVYSPNHLTSAVLRAGLKEVKPGEKVLVIGPGAGFELEQIAVRTGTVVKAVGINPLEVANSRYNAALSPYADLIQVSEGDLFNSSIIENGEQFDRIIWNAPIEDGAVEAPGMRDVAYGDWQARLLTRFFSEVRRYLTPRGEVSLSYFDNAKIRSLFSENHAALRTETTTADLPSEVPAGELKRADAYKVFHFGFQQPRAELRTAVSNDTLLERARANGYRFDTLLPLEQIAFAADAHLSPEFDDALRRELVRRYLGAPQLSVLNLKSPEYRQALEERLQFMRALLQDGALRARLGLTQAAVTESEKSGRVLFGTDRQSPQLELVLRAALPFFAGHEKVDEKQPAFLFAGTGAEKLREAVTGRDSGLSAIEKKLFGFNPDYAQALAEGLAPDSAAGVFVASATAEAINDLNRFVWTAVDSAAAYESVNTEGLLDLAESFYYRLHLLRELARQIENRRGEAGALHKQPADAEWAEFIRAFFRQNLPDAQVEVGADGRFDLSLNTVSRQLEVFRAAYQQIQAAA